MVAALRRSATVFRSRAREYFINGSVKTSCSTHHTGKKRSFSLQSSRSGIFFRRARTRLPWQSGKFRLKLSRMDSHERKFRFQFFPPREKIGDHVDAKSKKTAQECPGLERSGVPGQSKDVHDRAILRADAPDRCARSRKDARRRCRAMSGQNLVVKPCENLRRCMLLIRKNRILQDRERAADDLALMSRDAHIFRIVYWATRVIAPI